MADNETIESLHSLDSSLNNHKHHGGGENSFFEHVEVEEKKNDDDETTLHPDDMDQQGMTDEYSPSAPRASAATQMRTNRSSSNDWKPLYQKEQHQGGHNSFRENATLDSDSIYTNNDGGGGVSSNHNSTTLNNHNSTTASSDVEAKSTPSKHSADTTKGGTVALTPASVTPSVGAGSARAAQDEVGSYMSVEVIEPPSAEADTPKLGHYYGQKTTNQQQQQQSSEPIIQVVEHNNNTNVIDAQIQNMVNAQMNMKDLQLPNQEIGRPISNVAPTREAKMTPPNMVTLNNEPKNNTPFQEDGTGGSAFSLDGSLYTAGHDASTITKDTFLKQQDYNYLEEERQAYAAATMVDPEAPQQEATPDYDAYYDPNAYGPSSYSQEDGDEPSIGHSTITSLTKDTGILRTEQPDDLPVSRGILSGIEDVSDLSPPRHGTHHKPGTPSTFESGVLKDEEYGTSNGGGNGGNGYYGNHNSNKDPEPGTMWVFLQNATRDPTVQCLISLACIFAVILFFLVAVIIVLTSEDIQI